MWIAYCENKFSSGEFFAYAIDSSPANIYLVKVNNRNARLRCEICSYIIMRLERRHRGRSVVFIVNFEHIPDLIPVFLLLTLTGKCLLGLPKLTEHS